MSEEIRKLELRITELENQLKSLSGQQQSPANIDPEDMKVFQKVSKQLGLSGDFSEGQQPISCLQCLTCFGCLKCLSCFRCINECVCGPCSLCSIGGLGGSRFGSLG